MIEMAKAHERTCHEYQQHKQAHSAPVSGYQNPLIQTNALAKSFHEKEAIWQMREDPQPRRLPCPQEGMPQLWEEEPLDRDVSNKKKLLSWMYTITT